MKAYLNNLTKPLQGSRFRVLLSLVIWFSVVGVSGHYVVSNSPLGVSVAASWLGALALYLCATVLFLRISTRWLSLPLIMLLAGVVFLAIVEAAAIQFSGQGYNENFFFHIEPQSFRVAWQEYRLELILLPLLMLGFGLVLRWLIKPGDISNRRAGALLLTSAVFLTIVPQSTVISRFFKGWQDYKWQVQPREISNDAIAKLGDLGLTPLVVESMSVSARSPETPRNLILVFLESFDRSFVVEPEFAELTPGLRQIISEYGEWSSIYSGATVTIEGLIAANCGLMPPMSRPSDTMLGSNTPLARMACLPDVLKEAGYRQVFMGGAPGEFAGKAQFFTGHGFDEFIGWNDWKKNRTYFDTRNQWGLQDDSLFAEAIGKIDELRSLDKPYHLSLLTLSTHVPGAIAPDCKPLGGGRDVLLEGVYCTDQVLTRFIRALESRGDLEDTLLAVVADHAMFRTPKTRELFGDSMDDYRVFTLFAGAGALPASDKPGATYDLAPTLLDFLDIEHNVSFLQGKSLAKPAADDRYLITRYRDFTAGNTIQNDPNGCVDTQLPEQLEAPLDSCEKKVLSGLLGSYANQFSRSRISSLDDLGCNAYHSAEVSRDNETRKLSIRYAGQEQISQLVVEGWPINPARKGVFAFRLSANRSVVERRHFDLLSLLNQEHFLAWLGSISTEDQLLLAVSGDIHEWIEPQLSRLLDSFIPHESEFSFAILDGSGVAIVKVPDANGIVQLQHSDCLAEDWDGKSVPWSRARTIELAAELRERNQRPHFELIAVGGPNGKSRITGPEGITKLGRGLHLIRFDPWSERIVEHGHFDTYLSSDEDQRLQEWLANYEVGTHEFLIMVVSDDASRNLSEVSAVALIEMGFDQADQLVLRSSYAGVIGGDLSKPYVKISRTGGPLRLGVDLGGSMDSSHQPPPMSSTAPILVAHAGGSIGNRTYLNSREALDENYEYGYRLFEVDLSWSSDQQLVAIHDWDRSWESLGGRRGEVPTATEFARTWGQGGVDLLDLGELCEWLQVHDDAWIVTDIKAENTRGLEAIKENCGASDRFIPQIFETSEYGVARGLGYAHVILSLYRLAESPESILNMLEHSPLYAVALPEEMLEREPWKSKLMSQDTCVLAYTVNSPSNFTDLIEQGLCGVYTDFLVSRHSQGSLRTH